MKLITLTILILLCLSSCNHRSRVDITPHRVNPEADVFYQQARVLHSNRGDIESTLQVLALLDKALHIDSLNPHYYGLKARVLIEMGLLNPALDIQTHADKLGAINGDYLFQLGLLQAARGMEEEARRSFRRSDEFMTEVLRRYPDSLVAFVTQQAAYALYMGNDSLYMPDHRYVFDRFPDRAWDLEMTRRLRPSNLVRELLDLEERRTAMEENLKSSLSELWESLETGTERPVWMEYLENLPQNLE